MVTFVPRILSMAQPMATDFPVTGMELISSTEAFLDGFRPSPEGTIWFPQLEAVRVNEQKGIILPSRKNLSLSPDNVSELQFTTNVMFLDVGRILIESGCRLLKSRLENHPLDATRLRPWRLSTSHLDEELDFPVEVLFEDGHPAREIPTRFELEQRPSSHRHGEPLKRIAVEISNEMDQDDSIEVSESRNGAERSVTVFHSPEDGLQTFYDFRWKGAAVKGLRGLLRLPDVRLSDLGSELAARICASGLYDPMETGELAAGTSGNDFWIRAEQGEEPCAFSVEGHAEDNDDTLLVHLNPTEKSAGGNPMPLPPALFHLLWKGIFDFTD